MEQNIRQLLGEKQGKVGQMLKFTQDITGALKQEDADKVVELLELRQRLIKEVDILDGKLGLIFAGDFREFLKVIESDEGLKGIYDLLSEDLEKMHELDEKNMNTAKSFKSKIEEDISSLNKAGDRKSVV